MDAQEGTEMSSHRPENQEPSLCELGGLDVHVACSGRCAGRGGWSEALRAIETR